MILGGSRCRSMREPVRCTTVPAMVSMTTSRDALQSGNRESRGGDGRFLQ